MTEPQFVTNHTNVLVCITQDPSIRLRDVANAIGITERAAQRITKDLVSAGYLSATRDGRRNRYEVHLAVPMRDVGLKKVPLSTMLEGLHVAPDPQVNGANGKSGRARARRRTHSAESVA